MPQSESYIEHALEQYRIENAGSDTVDLVTPLDGFEDTRYFVERSDGSLDDGWTVSGIDQDGTVSLYKPTFDESNSVDALVRKIPYVELMMANEVANHIERRGNALTPEMGKRALMINKIHDITIDKRNVIADAEEILDKVK